MAGSKPVTPPAAGHDNGNDKSKKKKKSSKYNYSFGSRYPGNKLGHKWCNAFAPIAAMNVPYDMGWLWNASDGPGLKRPRGWRPGAIGKSMLRVMSFRLPREQAGKKDAPKKRRRFESSGGDGHESEPDEPLEPKPALRVNRKGDVYTIQVNPLRDITKIDEFEDPYVDCDPLIFKITKKRSPEETEKVEAKKLSKERKRRDDEIRKALNEAVEDICKCAYMDVFCNDLSAIDNVIDKCPAFEEPLCVCKSESLSSCSSNASWDIEYTPPFGCFDLTPRKKRVFVHTETQYNVLDGGEQGDGKKKKGGKSKKKK